MAGETDKFYIEQIETGGYPVGEGSSLDYTICGQVTAFTNSFTTISQFPWLQSRYGSLTQGVVVYHVEVLGGRPIEIQLFDPNTGVIGSSGILVASGSGSFTIVNPVADTNIELQVRRVIAPPVAGPNPRLLGANLEFNNL